MLESGRPLVKIDVQADWVHLKVWGIIRSW